MLKGLLSGIFGNRHDRERKRVQPIVDEINEHYERLQSVSEDELRSQTAKFREQLKERTSELDARIARRGKCRCRSRSPAAGAADATG